MLEYSWVKKHDIMKTRLCTLYDLAIAHQSSFLGCRYFSSGNQHPVATCPLRACQSSLSVYPKRVRTPAGFTSLSSGVGFRQNQTKSEVDDGQHRQKRKTARAPAAKTSLRKVAIEAQRSRDLSVEKPTAQDGHVATKVTVTAFCATEEYDMVQVDKILSLLGRDKDPYGIGLFPQVLHAQIAVKSNIHDNDGGSQEKGDIFIFPSGTVVAWAIPHNMVSRLVTQTLRPAAIKYHPKELEEEDLEFIEDPKRENSSIKGDTIIIGTKMRSSQPDGDAMESERAMEQDRIRDTVLAKVAFSSGLARSTKIAVLERMLRNYFDSTKTWVKMLARGGRLPRTRSPILAQTGQLLDLRAQLNLYSELIDSLPDLFWDSRSELGLEGYYDHVGRALDTNIRVKVLNEKMNYAQDIADVLREALGERLGVRLEWIIIILIAVEIGFNILHEFRYIQEKRAEKFAERLAEESLDGSE